LLEEAGWVVEEGKLVSETTGEQFSVDFIFVSPSLLRGKMPFVDTLTKIGIKTAARSPEVSNWLYRMRNGLFDGGSTNYIPSTTPGFQLRSRFSSDSADMKFSLNWGKIRDPAVDDLIDKIISAEDETSFHAATRALDRVLLWNFYFIPGMAQPGFRLVYWDKFGQPEDQTALLRTAWLDTWWWNEEKSNRVKAGMAELSGDSP